jgi:hypothetical protein
MVGILRLSTVDAERALFERLRYLDRLEKLSYAEKGFISKTVQTYALHECRTDPKTGHSCSFTRWIRLAAPWGYDTAFAAMRDVEALVDIPAEHLAEIPRSNFPVLKQLSTAVRGDAKVIEAAKVLEVDQFVEQIRRDHPDQHLETSKILRVRMDESAMVKVEEAIAEAMNRGATTKGDALEMIAAEALLEWKFEEAMSKATESVEP